MVSGISPPTTSREYAFGLIGKSRRLEREGMERGATGRALWGAAWTRRWRKSRSCACAPIEIRSRDREATPPARPPKDSAARSLP